MKYLTEASNAIFIVSSIISCFATALVCETGTRTEFGGLAAALRNRRTMDAFEIGIRNFVMLM